MNRHQYACPDCDADSSEFVVNAEGHDVCPHCGLIQSGSGVMHAPPPRGDEADAPRARKGAKRLRAARRHRHVSSKDRWVERLRDMAARAGLGRGIADTSAQIYRRAAEMPEWKNRKHDYQVGLLVACLFHSCNIHRAHRTPSELCATLGIDPRNARKMVKAVERAALEVGGGARRSPAAPTSPTDVPYEVLPRFAYRIESVPMDKLALVRKLAKAFYEALRPDVDNHRPDTITAGLLSVVLQRARIPVTDADIAKACLVAPNTVRSIANRMCALIAAKSL